MALRPATCAACTCLFTLSHIVARLQEVKPAVNRMLVYLAGTANHPFTLGTPSVHPQIRQLTAGLAGGLAHDRLHWRSAAFAHLWLLISARFGVCGISDDGGGGGGGDALAQALQLHLRHAVSGEVVLVRVRPVSCHALFFSFFLPEHACTSEPHQVSHPLPSRG